MPDLLNEIQDIVDSSSQVDPKFKDKRLYTRLTPEEIRRQLHEQKGYKLEDLTTSRTIYNKVLKLGYSLTKVQKTKPKKKIAETDAIFKKIKLINKEADSCPNVLRLSMDAKDRVKVGGGQEGAIVMPIYQHTIMTLGVIILRPMGFYCQNTMK